MKTHKPQSVLRLPTPPKGLSKEGKKLWKMVVSLYELDPPALEILHRALETLATVRTAEEQLALDGLTYRDAKGVIRAHPATGMLRDHRGLFLRYWKSLNLDLEPLGQVGRPNTMGGTRHAR
jgi:P27 family predicted phage terminase small subunit